MNRIEFEVICVSEREKKISQLMAAMDLGISGIAPSLKIVSWNTKKKLDKAYIAKMKRVLKKGLESEGYEVVSIKRRKIE